MSIENFQFFSYTKAHVSKHVYVTDRDSVQLALNIHSLEFV